jgi:GTP-binding protein
MKKLNKVVVVGRANVGKSTLFNRLSDSVKTMALDYVGVTRDFVQDTVSWNGRTFELIDTGGIQFKKSEDPLTEKVRLKAIEVLEKAAVVLFVCDGSVGVLPEDRAIAKFVHKMGKPTLLLINKVDMKMTQENLLDFKRLGFENMVEISAQHGTGTGDLLHEINERLPKEKDQLDEEPRLKIALLGKPNVGKSSLMNTLLKEERTLVSDIAGTTREAVSDKFVFHKEPIELTDTAGIRRRRSVDEGIEELMVKSSLQAVRDADIILLLVDAEQAQLANQELKLMQFAFEMGKAVILLRNKHDLLDDDLKERWKFDEEEFGHIFKRIEILTISCKTGHHIGKVMPLIMKVWQRYQWHIPMSELTQLFKNQLEKTPLMRNRQKLKVYSAKEVSSNPPTIRLNVNMPEWFEGSQLGFFENLLRKNYDLKGVPIKFVVRKVKPY